MLTHNYKAPDINLYVLLLHTTYYMIYINICNEKITYMIIIYFENIIKQQFIALKIKLLKKEQFQTDY